MFADFNSILVRLIVGRSEKIGLKCTYFNSILVRLIASEPLEEIAAIKLFQFHIGSINSFLYANFVSDESNFNSILVRLIAAINKKSLPK